MSNRAYDDLSQVTQSVDFAYDEVDRRFGVAHLHDETRDPVEMACECQRQLWAWAWNDACKNWDGFQCRCAVLAWVFHEPLRAYSMTEMAGRIGKKKQSLGRWVEDFKAQFPDIAKHLQHIKHE